MIITVTLNPAIDKTIEVNDFRTGALNKVIRTEQDPGGKGINVSRVIHALGGESLAMGFLGGDAGQFIENRFSTLGIAHHFIRVEGETRTNLKIFDSKTFETTEVNELGPALGSDELKALKEALGTRLSSEDIVVLSGSAPNSVPDDYYGDLIQMIKAKGARVVLDTSGPWFLSGVDAKPDFIKPNQGELEAFFDQKLEGDQELIEAARRFVKKGVGAVGVTLGSRGALYVTEDTAYRMAPLKVDVHSAVGAGDAFVAAYTLSMAQSLDLETCLRMAVATSAGAVATKGTKPPSREWVDAHMPQVVIEKL